MTRHPARRRGDRGMSVVEVAITMPALLLMIMIVVQFALWWHARHVVLAAAQEGARSARAYQSSAGAGQSRAEAYVQKLGGKMLTTHSVAASRTAVVATVDVGGTVISIVPGFSLTVHESSSGPVERFEPAP